MPCHGAGKRGDCRCLYLQRAQHINSAGGYLRALTEKARAGEFTVGPMLMAAFKSNGQRQGWRDDQVRRAGLLERYGEICPVGAISAEVQLLPSLRLADIDSGVAVLWP
jgi:hypothetical protein